MKEHENKAVEASGCKRLLDCAEDADRETAQLVCDKWAAWAQGKGDFISYHSDPMKVLRDLIAVELVQARRGKEAI